MKLISFISFFIVSTLVINSLCDRHVINIHELENKNDVCVKLGDEIEFNVSYNIFYYIKEENKKVQQIDKNMYKTVEEEDFTVVFTRESQPRSKFYPHVLSILEHSIGIVGEIFSKSYEFKVIIRQNHNVFRKLKCLIFK